MHIGTQMNGTHISLLDPEQTVMSASCPCVAHILVRKAGDKAKS